MRSVAIGLALVLTGLVASACARSGGTSGAPPTATGLMNVTSTSSEQALLVLLKFSDNASGTPKERQDFRGLEDRVMNAIDTEGVGEYDGNDAGQGWYTLYAYGASADRLAEVVVPIVQAAKPPPGSYAVKRYGPPGSREVRIDI